MQIFRYDLLGAVKYPKRVLRAVQRNSAVAVLDRYFHRRVAPHDDLYRRILKSRKDLTLVVHGSWDGDHVYGQRHLRRAKRCIRRLKRIGEDLNAMDRIYFSPYLEHRNKREFIKETFKELERLAPDITLVNSALKGGYTGYADFTEIHNVDYDAPVSRPYIWSSDGWDAHKINVKEWKHQFSDAHMFGLWVPSFNGKKSLTDSTPPLKRNHWPTTREIKQVRSYY